MFQIRWKHSVGGVPPPTAFEWPDRAMWQLDRAEQLERIRRQLRTGLARAESSRKPMFLRALGRDFELELDRLAGRALLAVGESHAELEERCRLLEELVDYYCDAVMPPSKGVDEIELSDCAREAVAGLSGEMRLVLRIQGEPIVFAARHYIVSLFEVAIRAAAAGPDDEVEVFLPPSSHGHAEFHVAWPRSSSDRRSRLQDEHDASRFLALVVAYVAKIGGTVGREAGVRENLIIRIPLTSRLEHGSSCMPEFDPVVIDQATAFAAGA